MIARYIHMTQLALFTNCAKLGQLSINLHILCVNVCIVSRAFYVYLIEICISRIRNVHLTQVRVVDRFNRIVGERVPIYTTQFRRSRRRNPVFKIRSNAR